MDYMGGNWDDVHFLEGFGWLSIALVIFTLWRPALAILGSIIFGGLYIASNFVTVLSKELVGALPYVVTIIVLIITSILNSKETQPPASLGLNYFREER